MGHGIGQEGRSWVAAPVEDVLLYNGQLWRRKFGRHCLDAQYCNQASYKLAVHHIAKNNKANTF